MLDFDSQGSGHDPGKDCPRFLIFSDATTALGKKCLILIYACRLESGEGLEKRLVLRFFCSFVQRVSAQPFGGRDAADLLRSATCSATVSVRLGTDCKEAAEKGVLTMLKSRRLLQGPGGGQALRLFVHEHVPVTLVIRFTLHVLLLSGGDAATSKESWRSMTRLDEAQFGACVSFLPFVVGHVHRCCRSQDASQAVWAVVR